MSHISILEPILMTAGDPAAVAVKESFLIRAVIINYNGYADTIECLHSLKAQIGVDCRPLVIDNGSADNSVAHIREAHPDVELLATSRNLGFCGGNNVGLERVLERGCDYLFLVNNDTIMEPDCLQKLIKCVRSSPSSAVASPAIYYYHDRISPWFTGSTMNKSEGTFVNSDAPLHTHEVFDIPWASGCAMLIPSDAMRDIGGFDERFFCYYEDVDWSLRARLKGYTCVLCPDAMLYHKVAASSGGNITPRLNYYDMRNRLLCLSKHTSGQERRNALRRQTRRALQQVKYYLLRYNTVDAKRHILALLVATADFYMKRYGPRQYRWLN